MTNFDINTYAEKLKVHRRNLHMIPELGRDLPKTKAYLLSVLENLDCKLTFLCDTGICAFFERGQKETWAFRADMDALPVTEVNECEYKSTHEGRMHACGHDGHMSMGLTLGEYVDTQKELQCNVLLIFQPAEETVGGAEEICKSGIFDEYNVTKVFGIHLWPFLPEGKLGSKPNALMPKSAEIRFHFRGKSAHATSPHEGCDALYIATDFIRTVYEKHAQILGAVPHFKDGIGDLPRAPQNRPEDKTIIHIGKFQSGVARNVVSDYTYLLGTVRAFSEENFQMIIGLLKDTLAEITEKYQCETEFSHSGGYPPVVNNEELYNEIRPVLMQLEGGYEEWEEPLMISEDYSFYGHYAPAVFFLLGTGTDIALHSVNFDFDEKILLGGFNLYKALLEK